MCVCVWVCTSFDPLSNQCVYSIFMACHLLAPSCRPSSSFLKPHSTSSEAGNMKKSLWVKGCGKKVGGSTTAWIFLCGIFGPAISTFVSPTWTKLRSLRRLHSAIPHFHFPSVSYFTITFPSFRLSPSIAWILCLSFAAWGLCVLC